MLHHHRAREAQLVGPGALLDGSPVEVHGGRAELRGPHVEGQGQLGHRVDHNGATCRSPRGVTVQRLPSPPSRRNRREGSTVGVLDGKVAVVAGASRGIGRGIAIELGAAGAVVYATGRTLDPRPAGSFGPLSGTDRKSV